MNNTKSISVCISVFISLAIVSCGGLRPTTENLLTASLISSSCLERSVKKIDTPSKLTTDVAKELVSLCRNSLEHEYDIRVALDAKKSDQENSVTISKEKAMINKALIYVNANRNI